MAAGGHFGCPKITFDRISGHFISIRNFLYFFDKMEGTTMSIIDNDNCDAAAAAADHAAAAALLTKT